MILDFSNLSAICPAEAENNKNGKINKPGNNVASVVLSKLESLVP